MGSAECGYHAGDCGAVCAATGELGEGVQLCSRVPVHGAPGVQDAGGGWRYWGEVETVAAVLGCITFVQPVCEITCFECNMTPFGSVLKPRAR